MSTREPSSYTAADLADPALDAATLALIAQYRPDLHPQVQQHPNCYPELKMWIAAQEPQAEPAQPAQPDAAGHPTQQDAAGQADAWAHAASTQPAASAQPAAQPAAPPTAEQWAAQFQAQTGREPTMTEYQAALNAGHIAQPRSAGQSDAAQQISAGAKQIATGAKDFFQTHVAPAAAGAARTMQERTTEARTSQAGWRAWLPFAVPGLALLGLIATLLPIATVGGSGFGGSLSMSVTFLDSDDGTGVLLILSMLIVLAFGITAILVRKKWAELAAAISAIALGAIWLLICLVGFGNIASQGASGFGFSVSAAPGFGLFLLTLVSIGLVAAGILLLIARRNAGSATPPQHPTYPPSAPPAT